MPSTVLYGIALAESGRHIEGIGRRPWPWTLNIEGRGYYYASRHEAYVALRRALAAGKSVDVGVMQVNWRWHHSRLYDAWQALDPYHNLRTGAHILREQYQIKREWWRAVGAYHSPNDPRRAEGYARRVARQLIEGVQR